MLEIFDKNRRRIAILENAFSVSESIGLNGLSTLEFQLPFEDKKAEYCQAFNMVRMNGGELYRIVFVGESEEDSSVKTYQCEHMLSSLLNTSLYGLHIVGNVGVYTRDVIKYVLSKQKDWVLYECDFSRQFEYAWEQETLFSAILSVSNRFVEKYKWVTDTTVYPWRLSLKRIDTTALPKAYIRRGFNRMSLTTGIDYKSIVTRLYALGAGEGVNQISIPGKYIQSPQKFIDKYGLIESIWTDRRYTSEKTLKEAAEAILAEIQEPYIEYSVDFIGDFEVGDIVQIVGETKSFIVQKNVEYGDAQNISYKIANKPYDVAQSLADLKERQRIESTYSQGATQIYAQSLQGNASNQEGLVINFFIPEDMRFVNEVIAKIKLESFRTYSKTAASNGGYDTTLSIQSQAQTLNTQTQSVSVETMTQDVTSGINVTGVVIWWTEETNPADGSKGTHSHDVKIKLSLPGEIFDATVPGQTISFDVPGQSIQFTIPGQDLSLSIPAHTHENTPGIFRFGNPSAFTLFVDGVNRGYYSGRDKDFNLTSFLTNAQGIITRGAWHSVTIVPNDLAYISIDMSVKGFIQSLGTVKV